MICATVHHNRILCCHVGLIGHILAILEEDEEKLSSQVISELFYNIPRACLLNRSPVPAMDLKSNRSGL